MSIILTASLVVFIGTLVVVGAIYMIDRGVK